MRCNNSWKRGNPPRFMAHISFFFMNLPWLTQDSSVRLEGPGRKELRDKEGEQLTLRMTYEGSPEEEYYLIYIDLPAQAVIDDSDPCVRKAQKTISP